MKKKSSLERSVNWTVPATLVIGTLGSTGLFGLIPYTYKIIGPGTIIVWIFTLICGFISALALAYVSTIWPDKAGAIYYPIYIALKEPLGSITGWAFIISWATGPVITLQIFAHYLFKSIILRQIFVSVVLTIFLFLNLFNIKIAGLIQTILSILKVVPLIIVSIAGLSYIKLSNFIPFWKSDIVDLSTLTNITLAFFASSMIVSWSTYVTDALASITPEVIDPHKNIPKATLIACLTAAVYIALVNIFAVGVLGDELGILQDPLFEAGKRVLGHVGYLLLLTALFTGVLGATNACFIVASRAMYQMAFEGVLPSIFMKLNKHLVPQTNIIFIYILNILMLTYTPLYIAIIAMVQVPGMLMRFLLSIACIKIRLTREWHEKASFKASWALIIANFIVGVISLIYIYSYGVLYGWNDIILGFIFIATTAITFSVNVKKLLTSRLSRLFHLTSYLKLKL